MLPQFPSLAVARPIQASDPAPESGGSKSLTTQAFARLRADILGGGILPMERLRIQALSERYAIGATAIREALSRLVTDGLVQFEDQRGFCVAPVTQADLVDLTRTRIKLETMALRSAIEHGGIDWEAGLLADYHRLSRTPPPTTDAALPIWADAHRKFHESLLAGSDSPWLLRMCRLLFDQSERYRNLAGRLTTVKDRSPDEHKLIVEASLARDADEATRLLTAHFEATTRIILRSAFGVGEESGKPAPRRARKAKAA